METYSVTAGSAAARILEESRRKETYRGGDFRDTPDGRLAFVSETRVPVHLFARAVREYDGNLREVAAHYGWPLWKVESAWAYAAAYQAEIAQDDRPQDARDAFAALRAILPPLVTFDLRTIPRVLAEFGVCGESHAGVLFISAKSFAANDFKAAGRALVNVAGRTAGEEWTNRVEFLTKT